MSESELLGEEMGDNDTTVTKVKAAKTAEMADVRFSLMLVGIIIVIFIAIYIALQNQSIANSVYGLVKLNSFSF